MRNRSVNQKIFLPVVGDLRIKVGILRRHVVGLNAAVSSIQASFGSPCKLLVDGCTLKDEKDQTLGTYNNIYQGATSLIVDGKRPHCLPGIANITRETQLVPFWQLKLYMIDVLEKTDFYYRLYE